MGGRGEGESLLGQNLMDAVRRKEREAASARGKDYAQRPTSCKGSLSMKHDTYSHRGSKHPSQDRYRRRSRSRSPRHFSPSSPSSRQRNPPPDRERERGREGDHHDHERPPAAPKPESQKLKALKAMYGDASAVKADD